MKAKTPTFFKESKLFKSTIDIFLNIFFPSQCEICKKTTPPLAFICEKCRRNHFPVEPIQCQKCGAFFLDASPLQKSPETCVECFDQRYAFRRNLSALPYQKKLKNLMLAYKFGKQIHLARLFADELYHLIKKNQLSTANVTLTSVPIHPRRFAQRHFNQAEEIACILAKKLNLPYLKLIKKIIHTEAQASLDLDDRATNIKDAFAPINKTLNRLREPTTIWLIDDVFTTGATIQTCAKILMRHPKVKEVSSITAFHG